MNTLTLPDAFLRHAIGLDQFSRFAQAAQGTPNYPPHNIAQISDDRYVLTLAVSGFSKDEIDVTLHKGALKINGAKKQVDNASADRQVFYLDMDEYTPSEIQAATQNIKDKIKTTNIQQKPPTFLYRGISFRDFERTFQLAEHIFVVGITLENGLLVINLERQVPEEAKPRRLTIG